MVVVVVVMVVVMCAGWLGRPAAEAPGAQVSGLDQEPRSRYVCVFSQSQPWCICCSYIVRCVILLLLCSVMLRYAMRCDGMLFVSCHPLSAPVFDGIAGIDVLAEGDAASSCSVEGLGEELEALGGGEGGGRDCSTEKEEEEQEEEEEKDHDSNKSNKSTESGDTQQQQQQAGGQKVAPGGSRLLEERGAAHSATGVRVPEQVHLGAATAAAVLPGVRVADVGVVRGAWS